MFQHLASLESLVRSLLATIALLLVVMLLAGGLVICGPAIHGDVIVANVTFSCMNDVLGYRGILVD